MKKILATILTALLIIQISYPIASASLRADARPAAIRSIPEIREKWNELKPKYTGEEFWEQPSVKSPYSLGTLAEGHIQDGLNMTNFARYLSGLPYDCVTDARLTSQAQHGAVLMAANDMLTHTPARPADMSLDFFTNGYDSAISSNLYYISGYKSYLLADSILSYMRDEDDYNISIVGHRRWILNPPLKKIGFGLAKSSSGAYYSTMQIFDKSGADFEYDYVSWPASGYHPVEMFFENDPWSVSLDPNKYDNKRTKDIAVKVTKKTTGKSWTLNKTSSTLAGNYFNVDTSSRGIDFCIIFRPRTIYTDGDIFDVEISGVYKINASTPTKIKFSTTFFNLNEPVEPEPTSPPTISVTAIPSKTVIYVDGVQQNFEAYLIGEYNYLKLRDIAYVLNETQKTFSLAYENKTSAIILQSGMPYETNGEEMTPPADKPANAHATQSSVYLDGRELSLTAYQIGDNNFFRLRDIAAALDFGVSYDHETKSGIIDVYAKYVEE